jgi:hypothetical protein
MAMSLSFQFREINHREAIGDDIGENSPEIPVPIHQESFVSAG